MVAGFELTPADFEDSFLGALWAVVQDAQSNRPAKKDDTEARDAKDLIVEWTKPRFGVMWSFLLIGQLVGSCSCSCSCSWMRLFFTAVFDVFDDAR